MGAALKEAADMPKVIVRKVVRAEVEKVFAAWTDPRLMERWFFPRGGIARSSNELRVGGSYSHEMIMSESETGCADGTPLEDGRVSYPHRGEYLLIQPPTKLVFTWNSPAVKNTRVTVDLRPVQGGTEVTIMHEFLATEADRKSHSEGWEECLESLGQFIG